MQKQLGFNPKTKKNEPNRLYLSKLDVKATDVYLRGEDSPKVSQTLATSGTAKSAVNLYKEPKEKDKDRYKIDTQKLNFSTANFSPAEIEIQNRDLVKHADEFLTDSESGWEVFLEPEAIQLLSFWCRTPQQMRRFIGIILNAKYRVEKDHKDIGVIIPLDDEELKPLMTKALRRYFNALISTSRMLRTTYTAPCKTYLAFGGINKRLENMRPNTPKKKSRPTTITVGCTTSPKRLQNPF